MLFEGTYNKMRIKFSAFQIDGQNIYFSRIGENGLYVHSLEEGLTKFVSFFDKEDFFCQELHLDSLKIDDFIMFLPYDGNYISFFNLKNFQMLYLEVSKVGASYFKGFRWKNTVWLIPQVISKNYENNSNLCTLNLSDFSIKSQKEINDFCLKYSLGSSFFSLSACAYERYIYIAIYEKKALLRINMETEEFDLIELSNVSSIYMVSVVDKCLWIIETTNEVINVFDLEGNFIEKKDITKEICKYGRLFKSVIKWKDEIYLFPQKSSCIYYVKDVIREVPNIKDIYHKANYSFAVGQIIGENNSLYIAPCFYDNMIVILDNGCIKIEDISIDIDEIIRISKEIRAKGCNHIFQEKDIGLNFFAELVSKY